VERDVAPVLAQLRKINPTIITVALDPEGSGPDTHYKVMQVISKALKLYQQETGRSDIQIWGYRNVWFRFHPSDADIYVPVSLNSLAVLENAFENCFGSQRDASFPSYELDGPFSKLARKIMVEQHQQMKTCLGIEYFHENNHPRIRASHGLVYIKKMTLDEFYARSYELQKTTEAVE
jgi:glucosamine-6-phosphate deaminase